MLQRPREALLYGLIRIGHRFRLGDRLPTGADCGV